MDALHRTLLALLLLCPPGAWAASAADGNGVEVAHGRSLSFVCKQGGSFNTTACARSYWKCAKKDTKPYAIRCPPGQYYNPNTERCADALRMPGCPVICGKKGIFNTTSCARSYLTCARPGAKAVTTTCEKGSVFNPAKSKCVTASQVDNCGQGSIGGGLSSNACPWPLSKVCATCTFTSWTGLPTCTSCQPGWYFPSKACASPSPFEFTLSLPAVIPAFPSNISFSSIPLSIRTFLLSRCPLTDCTEKAVVQYYTELALRFTDQFFQAYASAVGISAAELTSRKSIWVDALKQVQAINSAENMAFFAGVTTFTTWSQKELRNLAGVTAASDASNGGFDNLLDPAAAEQYLVTAAASYPDSFDWRNPVPGFPNGRVTSVKFQKIQEFWESILHQLMRRLGYCRSCWAFAAAATIETLWATQAGILRDISPQAFVDCFQNDQFFGCQGGDRPWASMQWAARQGVVPTPAYPYRGFTDDCSVSFNRNKTVVFGRSLRLNLSDPEILYRALLRTPVAITVWMDGNLAEIQTYKGGVFEFPYSKYPNDDQEDHAVALVGWGTETLKNGSKMDFWTIKNSWGAFGWGEDGYVRIRRRGPWRPGMYWEGIYSASVPALQASQPKATAGDN